MNRRLGSLLVCFVLLAFVAAAQAGDSVVIRLKDGSRWRGDLNDAVSLTYFNQGIEVPFQGKLVKVEELYIVVEGDVAGVVKRRTIFRGDVATMKTLSGDEANDVLEAARTTRPKPEERSEAISDAGDTSQPGVFVMPLTGTVGLEFRHEDMEAMAEHADEYGPGQIIVFEIQSGGGLVTEMEQIHITLSEIRKRHRLIAWIKEAISAACATAIHCDEIYFMTEGAAGSMTAFGGGVSWQGEELQRWLQTAGEWMELGGRSKYIAQVMIHSPLELSYDKDPDTGEVTFYPDMSGEFPLSGKGENLTFNSSNALHCGFADGIADTTDELAVLLDLPKWHEIDDFGRKLHEDWVATVKRAQEEIPRLAARMNYQGTGSGDPIQILGNQLKIYRELLRWWDRCPNACALMGVPPKEQLERIIDQLKFQLAQMRKQGR